MSATLSKSTTRARKRFSVTLHAAVAEECALQLWNGERKDGSEAQLKANSRNFSALGGPDFRAAKWN